MRDLLKEFAQRMASVVGGHKNAIVLLWLYSNPHRTYTRTLLSIRKIIAGLLSSPVCTEDVEREAREIVDSLFRKGFVGIRGRNVILREKGIALIKSLFDDRELAMIREIGQL